MIEMLVREEWVAPFAATVAAVVALLLALAMRRHLLAFFQVCYAVSFVPLVAAIGGARVSFWNAEIFEYPPDTVVVQYMALIWLVSSLAMIVAQFATGTVPSPARPRGAADVGGVYAGTRSEQSDPGEWNTRLLLLAAFALASVRILAPGEAVAVVPGFETLLSMAILLAWSVAHTRADRRLLLAAVVLTGLYLLSQVRTGDRDFVTIVAALSVLYLVRHRLSFLRLVGMSALAAAVVVGAAALSIVRMDLPFSYDELLVYLRFNSWNAIILPVVKMVDAEWDSGTWLLGRTYLDVILSLPPSPIFALLGLVKPIDVDNPAMWFYVQGLGGIHASGVAFRNFGLAGVFAQTAIFCWGLLKVQAAYEARPTFWRTFLLLAVSAVVMHTLWYGLVYLAHALAAFGAIYLLLRAFRRLWVRLGRAARRIERPIDADGAARSRAV
jgi:hypothetical protein